MIYLIIGLAVGFILGWTFKPADQILSESPSEFLEQKEKNLEKVRQYVKTRDRITNNAIEHLLGVSDSTATRYLKTLEKEGLIKRIGQSGQSVYYEVK